MGGASQALQAPGTRPPLGALRRPPAGSFRWSKPAKRVSERRASAMGHGHKEKEQERSPGRMQRGYEGRGRVFHPNASPEFDPHRELAMQKRRYVLCPSRKEGEDGAPKSMTSMKSKRAALARRQAAAAQSPAGSEKRKSLVRRSARRRGCLPETADGSSLPKGSASLAHQL